MKINIIFLIFYISTSIVYYICIEINENEINFNNSKFDSYGDIFNSKIISRSLNIGEIYTEFLYHHNIYKFEFNLENKYDVIVNFYPLDSNITIEAFCENGKEDNEIIKIQKITNYQYDAFTTLIKKEKLNYTSFLIKPLINSIDDNNKNRTYHLILNSFENKETPHLYLNEKEPILIYFDYLNFKKITLSYQLKDNLIDTPIVFSFFIKERAKFIVKNKNIKNKIIGYTDNIVIYPNSSDNNISLSIIPYYGKHNKNCSMIVKVTGNYSSASYLQKNIINSGFMPINITMQYYYMEIFKGEEGEILLNNKRQNGVLISKIIKKKNLDENQLKKDKYFPDKNESELFLNNKEYLVFNEFSQKLSFNSSQTNECEEGCYLLISYYSPLYGIKILDGIDFTLLIEIWDEEEFTPQIVNIPLDEYILGSFESTSINVHYYSIYLPENNNTIMEIQGTSDIQVFAKSGIKKINFIKPTQNTVSLIEKDKFENLKLVIDLNNYTENLGINSFENKYITFAVTKNDNEGFFSNYYFRIIQQNVNENFIIYPLDSNKANICQTKEENNYYVCYFLFKNKYKELLANSTIYSYGIEEITYNYTPIYKSDSYLIDFDKIKQHNHTEYSKSKGYLRVYPKYYSEIIIFKMISNYKEILTVLFNFYGQYKSLPSLNIYSYQLVYLRKESSNVINFNRVFPNFYRVFINATSGSGYLYYNKENDKTFISEKMFYSFYILEEIKCIHFFSTNNLVFNIKVNNQIKSDIMEEIFFGTTLKKKNNDTNFPIIYYLKDKYNKGININFNFDFYNIINENNYSIFGYEIEYDVIKRIEKENIKDIINNKYFKDTIYGKYDFYSQCGLIVFDSKKNNETNIIQNIKDYYYLIIIDIDNNYINLDFSLEMNVKSKNSKEYSLPLNKYIKGSFSLLNDNHFNSQVYHITVSQEEEIITRKYYILEFSSNYKNIELVFNNNVNYTKKIEEGVQVYFISNVTDLIDNSYNFTVRIVEKKEKIKKESKLLTDCNYLLRLYENENNESFDILFNKTHSFNKINNDSDDSDINKHSYNLTFANKPKDKSQNKTNNYTYIYYLRLLYKNKIYENEILNTTAQISSDIEYTLIETFKEDEEISFILNDLPDNEDFIVSFFIKVMNNLEEKKYYSMAFDISTRENEKIDENKYNNSKKIIFNICISFGAFLLIIIIIFIVIYIKFKKKNKDLQEQVNNISYSSKRDDTNSEADIII